jgi:outer membrane scaffolding protein for murein synthesis (MipA/OmpV family)
LALGAGVELESAYDGSDEYELELEPAGALHYRLDNHLFFWEGYELGWRGRFFDDLFVQAGGRYESGREADDSDQGRLDGLEDRDDHFVGFGEFRYGLWDWRAWLGGRVMAGQSDFGVLGVVAGGYRFGDSRDGTGTELFVYSTFGTSAFLNKDFGVTAGESITSGLEPTSLDGGYRSTGVTLIHRSNLTPRYRFGQLQLLISAGVEFYADDIQDSPIARKDYEAERGVAFLWVF